MKKFKDIVKKNPEPAKPANISAGQLGQYSATNQVSEDASLSTYLSSRGINPKFVSRDTKISHAKSNEFKTWKKNHMFEETLNESAMLNKYLMSRGINPDHLPTNQKVAYAKSSAFITWKQHHMNEDITKDKSDGDSRSKQAHSPTAQRQGELDKAAKFHTIKPVHTQTPIKKEGSQTGHLTPESVQVNESPKEGGRRKFSGMFSPAPKGTFAYDQAMRKKKHDDIAKNQSKDGSGMTSAIDRLQAHMNKEEVSQVSVNKFHKKLDKLVHSSFGKSSDEKKMKEEVEPIDEISKKALADYKPKSMASLKNAQANRDAAEPGKDMSKGFANLHAKSDAIAKKRVKGLKGYLQRVGGVKPTSEDVMDPQAAIAKVPDTDPSITEKKRGLSKSARMIKSLYKHHGIKEDLYDHEKEDKSVATYGKKPKFEKSDEKDSAGENKPNAAAVMTGGTTLTGEKRDDIEIDPMMRLRPGQPDPFKKDDKKKDDKKDGKKEEKK